MSQIPAECKAIKDEIDRLTKEKNDIASELNADGNAHAIKAETHGIVAEINQKKEGRTQQMLQQSWSHRNGGDLCRSGRAQDHRYEG